MTFDPKPHPGTDKAGAHLVHLMPAVAAGQSVDVASGFHGSGMPLDRSVEPTAAASEALPAAGSVAAVTARSIDPLHEAGLQTVSGSVRAQAPCIPIHRKHGRHAPEVGRCLIGMRRGISADFKARGLDKSRHSSGLGCRAPTIPQLIKPHDRAAAADKQKYLLREKTKTMLRNKRIYQRFNRGRFHKPIKLWSMTPVIKPKRDEI